MKHLSSGNATRVIMVTLGYGVDDYVNAMKKQLCHSRFPGVDCLVKLGLQYSLVLVDSTLRSPHNCHCVPGPGAPGVPRPARHVSSQQRRRVCPH